MSDPDCKSPCLAPLEGEAGELFALGVKQFNEGKWFACHETLERVWLPEPRPVREFYKGLIQLAVGLLHWRRGNLKGANRLLNAGLGRITPYRPVCHELDVSRLAQEAQSLLHELENGQPLNESRAPKMYFVRN